MENNKWYDMLCTEDAIIANKMIAYLDGRQNEQMVKLLNDPGKGRKKWQEKGIIPRSRNLTKMVIEKSGLLFSDKPPLIEVYKNNSINIPLSEQLQNLLDRSDWVEHFQNLDQVVRLLKTALLLIQINPIDQSLIFDVLHRGNSNIIVNPLTKEIETLIYRTSDEKSNLQTVRVWTKDAIYDYEYDSSTNNERLVKEIENSYGVVPIVIFHDTQQPRYTNWNYPGTDLIEINEMYNLHITDSEYAASWAKLQTLFTNAIIDGNDDTTEVIQPYGSALPKTVPGTPSIVGGPGSIVHLTSNVNEKPFVEYLGPNVDLAPIDDMFRSWVKEFASDWSVNVKNGNGTASSGFQLVVEEIDNLQLRKQRQKMFSAGIRRMWKILQKLFNMSTNSELYITFYEPTLPVDNKLQEEIWTMKIDNGRSSVIEYLMTTKGLTRDEAKNELIILRNDTKYYNSLIESINIETETELDDSEDKIEKE